MTSRLVGIGGLFGAGKDAVADHLVAEHQWIKMGMSDPLWKSLLTLDPLIPIDEEEGPDSRHMRLSELYKYLQDEGGFTPAEAYVEVKKFEEVRELLQKLGTEVGRNILGENTWVNAADAMIDLRLERGYDVILTGVRYPNELELIKKHGGQLWWVNRPDLSNGGQVAAHSSETSVGPADFDVMVENNGSLEKLYGVVDYMIQEW